MKQSENITELLSAIMDVQKEIPTMPKNAKAFNYRYTDLDTITSVLKPILARHEVSYMQFVGMNEQGQNTLTTRVFNRKGEYIEETTVLPKIESAKTNNAQTLGMAITYMRRYALCAMFGITSDEDVDANTVMLTQSANIPQTVQTVQNAMGGQVQTQNLGQEIKTLLESKDGNGMLIFTEADKARYREECKTKGLTVVLEDVKKELGNRLR